MHLTAASITLLNFKTVPAHFKGIEYYFTLCLNNCTGDWYGLNAGEDTLAPQIMSLK